MSLIKNPTLVCVTQMAHLLAELPNQVPPACGGVPPTRVHTAASSWSFRTGVVDEPAGP